MSSARLSEVELLTKLVGFDTTSDKPNTACINFIRDYLAGFGVKSEILATDDGQKACIWATIGGTDKSISDKPGIVLAGHSDVVPVDGQNWTSDPFTLTERDGNLYGRGSCDMKAFIACALSIVPDLIAASLKQPVHLAFTHDEETNMEGAIRLTDFLRAKNVKPAWVWIGEPTLLHIINAHKGVAAYTTEITGVPGHSSLPDKGLSAIEVATDFMGILRGLAQERRAKPYAGSRFDPAFTTMNLGTIKGGSAENIIPEHCELVWQVRAHPGDSAAAFSAEIEKRAYAALTPRFTAFAPRAGMKTCTCFDIPAFNPTQGNPGQAILTRLTGFTEPEAVSFATEAGFFQGLGTHVVVCGPGSIDVAHKADEYVSRQQLTSCVDLLKKVLISSAP